MRAAGLRVEDKAGKCVLGPRGSGERLRDQEKEVGGGEFSLDM